MLRKDYSRNLAIAASIFENFARADNFLTEVPNKSIIVYSIVVNGNEIHRSPRNLIIKKI